jgi:hypothetical protein
MPHSQRVVGNWLSANELAVQKKQKPSLKKSYTGILLIISGIQNQKANFILAIF